MKSKRFKEDLIKKSYNYSLSIIGLVNLLDKRDFAVQIMTKQLLRNATSIGANIVEAQAASSRKDFTNYLNHALKSANESKFWLGLFRDSKKAPVAKTNKHLKETDGLAKILGSTISTLRGKRKS